MEIISKKELKKISSRFRGLASDVRNAYYSEQNNALWELMEFIDKTPLLKEYIDSVYEEIPDLSNMITTVSQSFGMEGINLGRSSSERVNIIYQTSKYVVNNNIPTYTFGWHYCRESKSKQDFAVEFGNRYIYPLVKDIERNLIRELSIEMGLDEEVTYHISNISGEQINIGNHDSQITQNINNIQNNELTTAIQNIKNEIEKLPIESQKKELLEGVNSIEEIVNQKNPNKFILESVVDKLNNLAKGTIAATALIDNFDKILTWFGI